MRRSLRGCVGAGSERRSEDIPTLTPRENLALVTDVAQRPFSAEEALELLGMASTRSLCIAVVRWRADEMGATCFVRWFIVSRLNMPSVGWKFEY